MSEITTVGIDLAKQVVSVHGVDGCGRVVVRRTVRSGDTSDCYLCPWTLLSPIFPTGHTTFCKDSLYAAGLAINACFPFRSNPTDS